MTFLPLDPTHFDAAHFVLDCRGHGLDCRPGREGGAQVMGILNVTPDSFSDGGLYLDLEAALHRVEQMVEEGAAVIDVGGESSRPRGSAYGAGAVAVSEDVELARIVPVIEAIVGTFEKVIISVDTYKPAVARAALEAGAHLLNDITGLRYGDELARVAAAYGAPLIVMHALGRPGAMPHEHHYDDVVATVQASLARSVHRAAKAGVRHVVTDPGFGFGKTPEENLCLLNHVDALLALGRPVMVGLSRKSSIGTLLARGGPPVPVEERLFGTLGATAVAVLRGATLVRTHDVRATVELLYALSATARAGTLTPRPSDP